MSRSKFKTYIKIWLIRYQERLNRTEFSRITGVSAKAIEGIENKGSDPKTSHVQAICKAFPEYTLWMMLDEVDLDAGQISPMIKNFWLNRINVGRDSSDEKHEIKVIFDRRNRIQIEEIKDIVERWNGGDTDIEYPLFSRAYEGINLDL